MDVQLLKRFDLTQDVDSLYKEVLRNCKDKLWHWQTPTGIWHCINVNSIGFLDMNLAMEDRILCELNNKKLVIEKWIRNS